MNYYVNTCYQELLSLIEKIARKVGIAGPDDDDTVNSGGTPI